MSEVRLNRVIGIVLGMTLVGADDARAQASAPDLDEVVVTAQKRAQDIQDVPLAITALQGENLESLGAEGFRTFANRTPGLQLIESSPTNVQVAMRGVVSSRVTRDQVQNKATVGVYLDDIPMEVAANNTNLQLHDLERIEVLRGPQGTLFGAGAMGGAIRYVTRKADSRDFSAEIGLNVSTTESGELSRGADGVVNMPLVEDVLGARLLAYTTEYGGYLDNRSTGSRNSNDIGIDGFRLAVRGQPSDSLTIDLIAGYQQTKLDDVQHYFPELGDLYTYSFFPEITDQSSQYYSLTAALDLGFASLISTTGYQKRKEFSSFDVQVFNQLLGLPLNLITQDIPTRSYSDGFTQELRLQSEETQGLSWTLGLFYSDQKVGLTQSLIAPGIEALGFPPGALFGVPQDYLFDALVETRTRQSSIFGQLEYALTPALKVSVGLRYFDARDESNFDLRGLLQGGVFAAAPKLNESGFNPSFTVSYDVADDVMLYARAAKGFRLGGGNNPIPADLCGAELAALGYTEPPTTFDSDSLWNYEAGVKSRLADGRATINATAFYIDWSDLVVQSSLNCGFAVIANAGGAVSKGLELEASFRVTPGLQVFGFVTYTDSTLAEDLPRLGAVDGDRVPYVPEVQANVGFDFARPMGGGEIFLSGDGQYTDDRRTSLLQSQDQSLGDYTVFGARIGFRTARWDLQLFAENLGNERGELDRRDFGYGSVQAVAPGAIQTVVVRPRTFGVQGRMRF